MMLEEAGKGLANKGFEVEIINLYDYELKSCISCFLCKRKKDIPKHICEYKDSITPILDKVINADVVIFGSPNYLGYPTGQLRCFMERLFFPINSYMVDEKHKPVKIFDKFIPSAFIFTMNAPKSYFENSPYETIFDYNIFIGQHYFGYCEMLCAFDTYQFKDYSQYKANMFDPVHKLEQKEKQFPIDLKKSYELGERLGHMALDAKQ